ncbi:MAG: rhodanese-like domain-containing protein, partial [Dehalococcoidia bacterium]
LEFAYAPPYAPALDPLFGLGCVARSALLEGLEPIPPDSPLDGVVVLDVRQEKEVKSKPMPGAGVMHVQLGELRGKWDQIPKGTRVVCICPRGLRSAEAMRILLEHGFSDVVYLGGGIQMKTSRKK